VILVAGLFFALDDAHAPVVLWIAHRYALLGAMFSVGAILHYHRFRRDGRTRSMLWALLLSALGLLSDEGSISLIFWISAYELCLGRGGPISRLRAASPIAALVIIYTALYGFMGYGAAGSSCYLNPLTDPLTFLREAVLERIPFLVMGALTPVSAELGFTRIASGNLLPLLLAYGLGGLAVVLLIPHLRRNPMARFMALGALLSILPRATTYPHDRMLLLPTVGSAWVLASYVIDALLRDRSTAVPLALWFRRIVAVTILVIHGLMAPVQAVLDIDMHKRNAHGGLKAAMESEMPGPEGAGDARLLMLTTPTFGLFVAGLRWTEGIPYPAAVWAVTMGKGEFRFSRTGPASFAVKVLSRDFLQGIGPRDFREDFDFHEGDRFRRGVMEVTVTDVVDGDIREFEVTIDRPLDRPEVWLLTWDGGRFVRMPMSTWAQ
jgi:hypothetical protein